MVSMSRGDILQRLKYFGIVDESGNISEEVKFKEIIKSVFLGWVSLSRIKHFWGKEAIETRVYSDKVEKIRPFYHRPFHYVGFGSKTLFISEKEIHERIFFGEFIPCFISKFEDINIIRSICNLREKITDELIKSHKNCSAEDGDFCQGCKDNFAEELLKIPEEFLSPLQVKAHTIINIPLEIISAFINEEDLIEELEESTCPQCKRFILEHFKWCPDCGQKLKRKKEDTAINREKTLNELMAIYIEKKTGVPCEANKYLLDSRVEIDILASMRGKNLGIEGTSIINLDFSYIFKKLTTLLFMNVIFPKKENKIILWTLDYEADNEKNKEFIKKVTEKNFDILQSSMSSKIMNNNFISINQSDLNSLISEFDNILRKLLNSVNSMNNN